MEDEFSFYVQLSSHIRFLAGEKTAKIGQVLQGFFAQIWTSNFNLFDIYFSHLHCDLQFY